MCQADAPSFRRKRLPAQESRVSPPSPAAATALAREIELARFASCLSAEEYADTGALEARVLGQTHDAWWLDSYGVRQVFMGKVLPQHALPAGDGDALLRRNGRPVLFGACTMPQDARVHAEALSDNNRDTLTRVMRANGLPVLRHCTGAELLSSLYSTVGFRNSSLVWVEEDAGEASSGVLLSYKKLLGVLHGEPLPGLSNAAPACVDDELPPQLSAAAFRLLEAFQHTELLHLGMLHLALMRVGESERAIPTPPGTASFARRMGDWVCNWLDFEDVPDMELQKWARLAEDDALPCLTEWMITREIGSLASEAEWALLCKVCPLAYFPIKSDTAAVSVARALCGAIRWMDASPTDFDVIQGKAWGYVCRALLSLMTRMKGGLPHQRVSWESTAAVAREIAMARWVPPASVTRNWGYDPDVEGGGTTTTCCALLRAARGVAAGIAAGKWEERAADNVLREIGRLFRATAAVLSPSGSPLWDGELRTQWPEGTVLEMIMISLRDRDARVAKWVLTYCLLPAGACSHQYRDMLALC